MVAHISSDNKEESVLEHCKKTAEYAKELGENIGIVNLAFITAYLHDIGKFTNDFEEYIRKAVKGEIKSKGPTHSTVGGKMIYENYAGTNGYTRLTAMIVAWSIFSHHGLNDIISIDGDNVFQNRILNANESDYAEALDNFNLQNTEDIEKLFELSVIEIKNIIPKFAKSIEITIKENPKVDSNRMSSFYLGMFARLNLSILIEADRTKTAEFMTGVKSKIMTDTNEVWIDFIAKMDDELKRLNNSEKSNSKVNMARDEYSRLCKESFNKTTGIYQLNMPTGAGKTLASMNFALRHALEYNKIRIFYIAPYKSILTQNANVYRDLFQNDEAILEHHSDIIIEDDDENNVRKIYTQNWQSPIVVTTMVQFLNTLFGGKTQQIRRLQALTNSVIIIDEIQSLPVKTINMFNAAMNFLKIFGTTIVLCSATQPLLHETSIPIEADGNLIDDDYKIRECFKRNEIVNLCEKIKNCEAIAKYANKLTKNSNSGIIIVNTKLAALKIYNLLKDMLSEEVSLYHLSTNMCPEHQKNVIKDFKDALKDKNQKAICVSTPILEAGVDISAEWVIRSASGWDSFMQSAGRSNRNGEYNIGYVYLVECIEENIGSLEDVSIGKNSTEETLRAFEHDRAAFDNDMMSQEFIDYYYKRYFLKREPQMNYSVKKANTNIFEMLSLNEYATNEAKRKNGSGYVGKLTQAFKEAGNDFEVITQDMQGVITPYKEGKQIITDLAGMSIYDNPNILLKKAQKYSVNLFRNKFKEYLDSGIIYKLDNLDVYCLMEGYYNEKIGINKESMLDDLFF